MLTTVVLSVPLVIVTLVVPLIAGMTWTLGCWLMNRLLAGFG